GGQHLRRRQAGGGHQCRRARVVAVGEDADIAADAERGARRAGRRDRRPRGPHSRGPPRRRHDRRQPAVGKRHRRRPEGPALLALRADPRQGRPRLCGGAGQAVRRARRLARRAHPQPVGRQHAETDPGPHPGARTALHRRRPAHSGPGHRRGGLRA
ncbi:hypothetical protein OY671_011984, partial [Metschnikowia pulcherrima]